MAIVIPGKAVFLEHPRTGSTSIRAALRKSGGQPFGRHSFIKAKRGEKTVATVRNPFDVLVSWWLITGQTSFEEFLLEDHEGFMTKGGRLFYYYKHVDIWMRFENLNIDFVSVCRRLGIRPTVLPRFNPTKMKKDYRTYHTPETIEIVKEKYAKELEQFNYRWG